MTKNKVAIISSYYQNWNMGGLLQAYALNKAIGKLGYDAEHIRLCYAEPAENGSLPKRVRTVLTRHRISTELIERFYCRKQHQTNNRKKFREFHDNYINGSYACYDAITVQKLNKRYNTFVAGSDQIWNPQFWSDRLLGVFGLVFANPEKRTVSYAASIGSEKAAVGKEKTFKTILDGLDFISVREKAAENYLQPLTDKEIAVVLDPTLLIEREEWEAISAKPRDDSPYVYAYFLEEEEPHTEQLQYIADSMDLPIKCISTISNIYIRNGIDSQIEDAGPREFLNYILNADMIVTNSFHGMVFSVIFNKPFWVVKRYKDSDKSSANNRITDFLNEFGLENRLLEDGEVPNIDMLKSIDYKQVEQILTEKRIESIEWLRNALE